MNLVQKLSMSCKSISNKLKKDSSWEDDAQFEQEYKRQRKLTAGSFATAAAGSGLKNGLSNFVSIINLPGRISRKKRNLRKRSSQSFASNQISVKSEPVEEAANGTKKANYDPNEFVEGDEMYSALIHYAKEKDNIILQDELAFADELFDDDESVQFIQDFNENLRNLQDKVSK
eukprot:snap_masked-scaffold_3-processed-gene-7.4-mRNA-1 protein AED:1.00 eAED:1.00 QI:0/-1/0/0/-1/1/1/0/173